MRLPNKPRYLAQEYDYPVTDRLDMREVLEPDFDILGAEDKLYVDLSEVRSNDFSSDIKNQLNLDEADCLIKPVRVYPKIVFSGYKGSGKTLELRRLQKELDHPKGYIVILVEVEKEFELTSFKPEDFFVILIAKLVERLSKSGIPFHSLALEDLQKEWLSDKSVIEEINSVTKDSLEVSAGVGGNFLNILKLAAGLKALLSNENKTSTIIREKIDRNKPELINRFNLILREIRESLRTNPNAAKDILFIFDGSEKIKFQTYESIFIDEAQMITQIELCMIASVPIETFFKITHGYALQFYDSVLLPMLKPSPEANEKMREILQRRVVLENIIEPDALDAVLKYSGGSIRQLLKIMNVAIIGTRSKITLPYLEEVIDKKLSARMYDQLTTEHKEILKNKKYIDSNGKPNVADPHTWHLVDGLVLLRYNGTIETNPLIAKYFQ